MPRTKYKRKVTGKAAERMLSATEQVGALVPKTDGPVIPSTANAEAQPEKHEGPKGHPVRGDSLAATLFGVERESVLREMHRVHVRMVMFYTSAEGGGLTLEEAVKTASGFPDDATVEEQLDRILRMPVEIVSWYAMNKLCGSSPQTAEALWKLLKEEARNEFESGHRAAEVFEPVHWLRDAWQRARYLAIRDSFIEQWQPQGGIDLAMIDMLTQSFYLYLYWTEQSVLRAQTEMRADPPEWVLARRQREHEFPRDRSGMKGNWEPAYASEQEAVEHAAQMADRYGRAFQRTLRAMRDLRRYAAPVTINNPQQVNIAADGGQQVNLSKN
jgi:hypothetical protein